MYRSDWAYILAGIVLSVVMGAGLFVLGSWRVSLSAPLYSYPSNAQQLVDSGLTGRPAPGSPSAPVAVDMVLVDGVQSTILFHLTQPLPATTPIQGGQQSDSFSVALHDDRGHSYPPRGGTVSEGGRAPLPPGLAGVLWQALHVPTPVRPPQGFVTFASLPVTAHAAVVAIAYANHRETIRVPVRLAALRGAVTTYPLRRAVARQGVAVRPQSLLMSRFSASAELAYSLDAPSFATGMPRARYSLADTRGHAVQGHGNFGRCSAPARTGAQMHCVEWVDFTSPSKGTRLTLTVTLSDPAGGALRGAPWRVPFAIP